MKQIAILGSTGSIGRQAIDVINRHKDLYEAGLLTANDNWECLAKQALALEPDTVVIANKQHYTKLKEALTSC